MMVGDLIIGDEWWMVKWYIDDLEFPTLQKIWILVGVFFRLQKSLLGVVLALKVVFTKAPLIAPTLKVLTFRGGSKPSPPKTAPKGEFLGRF